MIIGFWPALSYTALRRTCSPSFASALPTRTMAGVTLYNGGATPPPAGFQPIDPSYPVDGMTAIGFAHLSTLEAGNLNNTSQSRLFEYADNLTWNSSGHTARSS